MTTLASSPSSVIVTLQQLIKANASNPRLQQPLVAMIQAAGNPNSIESIPFQQFRLDSRQLAANDVFVLLKVRHQTVKRLAIIYYRPPKKLLLSCQKSIL